jgi:hypothetical protein
MSDTYCTRCRAAVALASALTVLWNGARRRAARRCCRWRVGRTRGFGGARRR